MFVLRKTQSVLIMFAKFKPASMVVLQERLMEASKLQFACANPDKSNKTKQRLRNIIIQQESQLDFESHKSHPVPHAMLVNIVEQLVIWHDY